MRKSIVRILTIGLFSLLCILTFSCKKEDPTGKDRQEQPEPEPTPPPKTLKEIYQHGRIQKVPYSENVIRTITNENNNIFINEIIRVQVYIGDDDIDVFVYHKWTSFDDEKRWDSAYWLRNYSSSQPYHAKFSEIVIHYDLTRLENIECSLTWEKYPIFNLNISYETANGTKVHIIGDDLKLTDRDLIKQKFD